MGWDSDQYPSNWNSIRKRILKRDGYECTKCGTSNDQLHVHHITPVSEGGSHAPKNLRTLCHSCHEDVHGHRIPTKGGSGSGSASMWKKAVWLPTWESTNTDTDDVNLDEISDTFIEPLRRENSRSKGDWIGRQIGVLLSTFIITFPFLWILQDGILRGEEVITSIIGSLIVYIIFLLIPVLSIPYILIAILVGIVTWLISRYGLERYYESNS